MRHSRARRARRARAVVAVAAASAAAVTACAHAPDARQVGAGAAGTIPGVSYLSVSPGPGTTGAATAGGITVDARHGGKVTRVTVASSGDKVTGALNAAGTSWHSAWSLNNGTRYTVTAHGTDPRGRPVTTTSTFTTQTPKNTFHTEIFEGYRQTYGVGMPVMLTFSQPIRDRAAVERALTLTTSKPVVGAWYWDGDERAYFRPRDYWPAGTTVTLDAHLNGVDAGGGLYGAADLTQTFDIGQSVVAVASTTTHYTQIYIDGQLRYNWPISTGRGSMPTPDGTYLTVEKGNPVRMIGGGKKGSPGYYNELVEYAVRFTFSGDYYHAAPWSVVSQGYSNVSHGCVNLSPADAKVYYQMAIPGDPVTITSSPKGGKWDNGWTQWFYDWHQYLAGSATHMAVEAGPDGSRLVSPSAVPADTATAPTGTSATGNYLSAGLRVPGRSRWRFPTGSRWLRVTGARCRLGDVRGLRGARGDGEDHAEGEREGQRHQERRGGARRGLPAPGSPAAGPLSDSAFDQTRPAAGEHDHLRSIGIAEGQRNSETNPLSRC